MDGERADYVDILLIIVYINLSSPPLGIGMIFAIKRVISKGNYYVLSDI